MPCRLTAKDLKAPTGRKLHNTNPNELWEKRNASTAPRKGYCMNKHPGSLSHVVGRQILLLQAETACNESMNADNNDW